MILEVGKYLLWLWAQEVWSSVSSAFPFLFIGCECGFFLLWLKGILQTLPGAKDWAHSRAASADCSNVVPARHRNKWVKSLISLSSTSGRQCARQGPYVVLLRLCHTERRAEEASRSAVLRCLHPVDFSVSHNLKRMKPLDLCRQTEGTVSPSLNGGHLPSLCSFLSSDLNKVWNKHLSKSVVLFHSFTLGWVGQLPSCSPHTRRF